MRRCLVDYVGDGQRLTKTVNGTTTTYHYNNGMLLSETTDDETLRYYYDSTGKVASLIHENADGEEIGYFYTRNAQGDIIGIYRSKDSKLMGTYEYDLWGRLISLTPTEDDTTGITEKNPYRYRSYYYDEETGFYYLSARYYDPQIRRFISADSMNAIMLATTDVGCKNMFVYAENNPITNKDGSGNFVDTIFDMISLAGSIADVIKKPNDPMAWACLAGDAADVILPGVAGIGEVIRGAKTVAVVAGAAGTAVGVAKGATKLADKIDAVVDAAKSIGKKVAKSDIPTKPNQIHHFATNKSKKYTCQFESITKKYDLDLDGDWNKASIPHQGRHPNAYHDYVLDNMQKFDRIANGEQNKFLILYDQMKQKIIDTPEMLYKDYWKK